MTTRDSSLDATQSQAGKPNRGLRADELPSIPRRLIDLEIIHLAFLAAGVIAMRMLLPDQITQTSGLSFMTKSARKCTVFDLCGPMRHFS